MKKIFYLCILAIILSAFGPSPNTTLPSLDALKPLTFDAAALLNNTINPELTYKLVFDDEFKALPLNTTRWMTQLQWGRTNSPELQYYTTNAFSFSGGVLHIKAQKQWLAGKAYTSGAIISYKSFRFTYGIIKIRARIPSGRGLWPAFWLLDYAGGAQEIDIAEFVGHQPNIAYMTLHYPTSSGNKSLGGHYTGPNFAAGYHIFTVDWNPSAITWYIDGIKRYSLTQHIPSKPMYLIMNLAVGGDWPGPPTSSTKFPAYLHIDYVRIYKRQ